MRKLQLLITTYYLQFFWHDMNLKLKLGYIFMNEVGQWFYQLDHVAFSKILFWPVDCALFFYQICYVQKSVL